MIRMDRRGRSAHGPRAMDILTALDPRSNYSTPQLQAILGAWVMTGLVEKKKKVEVGNGHVEEDDYTKQSIYSLLYSMYRSMGDVKAADGTLYELTFNTWGYAWPKGWGPSPVGREDPQLFGKNAYTGLFSYGPVRDYVAQRDGRVHLVEMGCGTGAGAHHITKHVFPECTYEAFDMQQAAIETCRRRHVPELGGRLKATRADCTKLPIADSSADIVVVCETHVTEVGGQATDEDQRFFRNAARGLKPGGYLVWGNAIPDSTWQPCFDFLESIGMRRVDEKDVTEEAVLARDLDEARVDAYVDQCLDKFFGFKIPVVGWNKRVEAGQALKNFYRNPGTRLYMDMKTRADTYRVVRFQKQGN